MRISILEAKFVRKSAHYTWVNTVYSAVHFSFRPLVLLRPCLTGIASTHKGKQIITYQLKI